MKVINEHPHYTDEARRTEVLQQTYLQIQRKIYYQRTERIKTDAKCALRQAVSR